VLKDDEGPRLALQTGLEGDAADARRLLAESPLATLTRNVFSDWRMVGPVSGELELDLGLVAGAPPPRVSLDLALAGVDADMTGLALPVRDISGELRYRSDSGFTGSRLAGRLWDAPLGAVARSAPADAVDLELHGQVDGEALSEWLGVPLLAFASGHSAVSGELRLQPGNGAELQLRSDLLGMSLDAPRPFAKPPGQSLPLSRSVCPSVPIRPCP